MTGKIPARLAAARDRPRLGAYGPLRIPEIRTPKEARARITKRGSLWLLTELRREISLSATPGVLSRSDEGA